MLLGLHLLQVTSLISILGNISLIDQIKKITAHIIVKFLFKSRFEFDSSRDSKFSFEEDLGSSVSWRFSSSEFDLSKFEGFEVLARMVN